MSNPTLAEGSPTPTHTKRKSRRFGGLLIWFGVVVVVLVAALGVDQVAASQATKAARKTNAEAKIVQTSHGDMQVLVKGDPSKQAVVLVHGLLGSLEWWQKIMPQLSQNYYVVAVDLIGDGGSEMPRSGPYSIQDEADSVSQVMRQEGMSHAVLVGHSMGGAVVTSIAEQFPDLARSVVLIDTSSSYAHVSLGIADKLATTPLVGPLVKQLAGIKPEDVDASAFAPGFNPAQGFTNPDQPWVDFTEMTWSSFYDTQQMFPEFTAQQSLDKRLSAVGKPLLVLFGSEDQIAIDMTADLTDYRAVPTSTVHVIEGAGHSPMVEKPTETLRYLTGFISSP